MLNIGVYTHNMNRAKIPISKKRSEIVQNCTCFNLRKATRAVTQLFDEALKPAGLYATQFTLLAAISFRKDATITELSKALIMDRTTLTRNLKLRCLRHFCCCLARFCSRLALSALRRAEIVCALLTFFFRCFCCFWLIIATSHFLEL